MTSARQLTGSAAEPIRIEGLAALRIGDGPAVLMLPGYTGTKEDFAPILDAVAAAEFCATAVDLPGQYESPGPDQPAAYTADALAAVVCRVAARLGGPVHLLGHSFGGLVARAAVLRRPMLFASLVLMGSGPGAIDGRRRAMIDSLEPVLPAVGLAGVYAELERLSAQDPAYAAPPPDLADFLRRRFLASSPVMLAGMARALRTEPDRTVELATCAVPTLVLFGESDDAWSPAVQTEMAHRLGAQLAVIASAAHSPAAENPGATASALTRFWRNVR